MPEPVLEYFPVCLDGSESAAAFSMQLINAVSGPQGMVAMVGPNRPVAFQPLMSASGRETAYVSAGAAKLLRGMGIQAAIDPNPVSLRDLPDGLALVVGDNVDFLAYDARRR